MAKTKKITQAYPDIDELELPTLDSQVEGFEFPEIDENGKCILKDIPDVDLEEKRTAQGSTVFISLYGGSTGTKKDGYEPDFNRAGRIMIAGKDGRTWMQYLDLLALFNLVVDNLEFVKYQILRNRADIKEEIHKKSKFLG